MNKSVYSLVLTDDVVAEIDRIAYENGTSRSNTVNQILAEYVSYDTPEKRIREVFSEVENLLTGSSRFQVMMQPSDSMFSLRSALAYKYNPTVRYSVELNRNLQPAIGELRVSVRSQSSALRLYMLQFFKLWSRIEQNLVGHVECAMADDRYIRRLAVAEDRKLDNEALGQAIAETVFQQSGSAGDGDRAGREPVWRLSAQEPGDPLT